MILVMNKFWNFFEPLLCRAGLNFTMTISKS
ncbi:hypothetical protein Mettu_1504 [Methylobacter tundripaludum SV96]|uniref:Uncharacterized protein n=1 Tax=Methylobacter tundripaludum (strain ATCC BAA-1195 / DSM 17260 / SV96) TaxID=697282 RepID=G3IU82_METTV|nr:hypothetical protein Mettu_1504 [Methylobacter tundripaludum SV96]